MSTDSKVLKVKNPHRKSDEDIRKQAFLQVGDRVPEYARSGITPIQVPAVKHEMLLTTKLQAPLSVGKTDLLDQNKSHFYDEPLSKVPISDEFSTVEDPSASPPLEIEENDFLLSEEIRNVKYLVLLFNEKGYEIVLYCNGEDEVKEYIISKMEENQAIKMDDFLVLNVLKPEFKIILG